MLYVLSTVSNFDKDQNLRKVRIFGIIYTESETNPLKKTNGGMSMDEVEFGKALTVFHNAGQLMELLKNYPDRTPVMVCGAPGLLY